jgi:flagellum-specific ATP synthase
MPLIVDDGHMESAISFREILSIYKDAEDLITIGAYENGSNPKIDYAISKIDTLNDFLKQRVKEFTSYEDTIVGLKGIVN